ncbi:MAG: hypothetical protein IH594_00315 [Bacteroidales bacterium]|nr:hypothetical protein [Bacteroidales bacterium]
MISTSNKLKLTYVFMLMFLLLSCSSDTKIFEEYVKFPNMSWNRFNILTFEVPVEKAGEMIDIDIAIRHIPEIPYKNLEFNMSVFTPSGDMRTADYTLNSRTMKVID